MLGKGLLDRNPKSIMFSNMYLDPQQILKRKICNESVIFILTFLIYYKYLLGKILYDNISGFDRKDAILMPLITNPVLIIAIKIIAAQ